MRPRPLAGFPAGLVALLLVMIVDLADVDLRAGVVGRADVPTGASGYLRSVGSGSR